MTDADLIADGLKWREAEAEGHVVTFSADGYGLQHPPSCRPDLIACPYNRHLAGLDGPARPPGRYRMTWGRVGEPSPAYEPLS